LRRCWNHSAAKRCGVTPETRPAQASIRRGEDRAPSFSNDRGAIILRAILRPGKTSVPRRARGILPGGPSDADPEPGIGAGLGSVAGQEGPRRIPQPGRGSAPDEYLDQLREVDSTQVCTVKG